MYRKSQAEIFIQTLAELLDDERECQKARRRLQHKDHADRFVQAFWAKRDDSRRPSGWTPPGSRTDPGAAWQARND